VGVVTQVVAAVAAFFIARIVPAGRPRRWAAELVVSILGALAAGVVATALDFGGWREAEWRAAVLGFVTALLLIGVIRITLLWRKPSNTSPEAHS
jgi:uncharacterized membrane protein YeaQ/YmgE (transglycosylase-associated protein family)